MKSFRTFISESLEQKDLKYQEAAKMLLSDDPYESYYALENIEFVYTPDERKKIAEEVVSIVKQDRAGNINISNPYAILIVLEESGLVEILDFPGSPFESQFLIKEQMSVGTFKGLFEYKNITLTEVEITDDLLRGLTSVEMLTIYGEKSLGAKNNIQVENISKNVFADCVSLKKLTISGFEIDKISENIFWNCSKLAVVNITNGKVKEISNTAFSSDTLKKIFLDENEIENITSDSFLNCNKLEVLSLSKNRLAQIPDNLPSSIKELHLNHNRIERINPGVFNNLNNLIALDLSSNPISTIAEKSFLGLSNLLYLRLAYLSNDINIEPGAFFKLETLKELDLIGTELTTVDSDQIESELPVSTEVMYELPF